MFLCLLRFFQKKKVNEQRKQTFGYTEQIGGYERGWGREEW